MEINYEELRLLEKLNITISLSDWLHLNNFIGFFLQTYFEIRADHC